MLFRSNWRADTTFADAALPLFRPAPWLPVPPPVPWLPVPPPEEPHAAASMTAVTLPNSAALRRSMRRRLQDACHVLVPGGALR